MYITEPGGSNCQPKFSRRSGCTCGCGDDDDFWADDFGGRLDGIFGPISQANFVITRDLSPCFAYTEIWLPRARARDADEADEAAEEEDVNTTVMASVAPLVTPAKAEAEVIEAAPVEFVRKRKVWN